MDCCHILDPSFARIPSFTLVKEEAANECLERLEIFVQTDCCLFPTDYFKTNSEQFFVFEVDFELDFVVAATQ